jgi:hypothetical protein
MTRTPDRIFQAAARDLLLQRIEQQGRVDAHAALRPATPPPREWLRSAVATLLVGGVVAAAWLAVAGLQQGQPQPPRPVGAASTTRPTPPPSLAPTRGPTQIVSAPAPVETPAPSDAPPPSGSPAVPALITPAGWHEVTRPELHAWVLQRGISADDPANQAIWEQETWADIRCMAGKGYLYDPIDQADDDRTTGVGLSTLSAGQRNGFQVALDGPATDAPYDWRTAGCHGASVHAAGKDHAN